MTRSNVTRAVVLLLFLSTAYYVLVQVRAFDPATFSLKDFVLLLPTIIGFRALQDQHRSVQATPSGGTHPELLTGGGVPSKPLRGSLLELPLGRVFDNGVFGGLVGGGLMALLVGIPFVDGAIAVAQRGVASGWTSGCGWTWEVAAWDRSAFTLLAQVLLYGALSGAVLGAAMQVGGAMGARADGSRRLRGTAMAVGAALAGAVAGLFLGFLAGAFFVRRHLPVIDDLGFFVFAAVSALVPVVAVVLYEAPVKLKALLRALVAGGVVAGVAATAFYYLYPFTWVAQNFLLSPDNCGEVTMVRAVIGGGLVGVAGGAVVGILFGTTTALVRLWRSAAETGSAG